MNNYLKLAALVGSGALFAIGCPDPNVPDPPLDPDGAAPATCESVCAHWSELGCKEAEPTPAGASCVEVCENLQQGNLPDDLDCQAAVTSCAEIDDC
jgi:hypothetical protein